jgi:hypothetical protein
MAADKLHDSGIVLMMSGIGTKRTCLGWSNDVR